MGLDQCDPHRCRRTQPSIARTLRSSHLRDLCQKSSLRIMAGVCSTCTSEVSRRQCKAPQKISFMYRSSIPQCVKSGSGSPELASPRATEPSRTARRRCTELSGLRTCFCQPGRHAEGIAGRNSKRAQFHLRCLRFTFFEAGLLGILSPTHESWTHLRGKRAVCSLSLVRCSLPGR